ncbi:poly(U)-specific endoribonuclease [Lates japonicus]|uniref:Uridylate-specific endoribonuclease n=1 Tax=Lates japonicus TaxID=270547 RepID=A0AAD3N255_LATJO|nr:poly(U)-specific endoribonuclease [Lates japonicus]
MKVIALLALCVTLFCQGYSNSLDSCQGRCGYGTDSNFSCQCNPSCERYSDCCSDYAELCKAGATSCKGRCGEKYNSQNKCHCNSKCTQYKNCCSDYTDLCDSDGEWWWQCSCLRYLDESSLLQTHMRLSWLLDNYHRMTGQTEDFNPQLAEQETSSRTMSNTELGRGAVCLPLHKSQVSSRPMGGRAHHSNYTWDRAPR